MKKFKHITIILFSLLLTVSCDKDFEEINTDPNNPTSVPSDLLIPGIVRTAQNSSYTLFVGGDMGACWAQHFAKVQYNDEERYIPRQGTITGVWNNFYAGGNGTSNTGVISDAVSMYDIAMTEENNNMMGVALTLQAYGFSFLTDVYGDIPFSEAIKAGEGNIAPSYDAQEDIYTGVLKMLDNAIALLGTSGAIDGTNDILYNGDAMAWKRFASSLKFRVLMRASGKMDVSGQLKALVSAGNLFMSNNEDAKLIYLTSQPSANPIYENIVYGTRNEWKINSTLVTLLETSGDPRLAVYAQKNADGEYRGKPSGYENVPNDDYNYDNVSALGEFYLRPELPGFFVSYPELQFLMAEAVVEGYITGDANMYYIEGIRASLEFNEIAVGDISGFLGERILSSDKSIALEQIALQKYISLFSQGVETWNEWRRTGIPALTPAFEGAINEIPSRYNYPTTEASINKENYDAAVASQGPDVLTTPVWWMN